MSNWREHEYAVVDLELTGMDPRSSEVLSIGLVPVVGGRIQVAASYYREVRPKAAPERDSVVIHGIRPVDAAAAPLPAEVAEEVRAQLAGRVLVAHVAEIERRFLNEWLDDERIEADEVVDTDVLARLVIAQRGGPLVDNHVGLGAAAKHFGLPEHRRHHALGDALTTAQLFIALASLYEGGQGSLSDLRRAGRVLRKESRRARFRRRFDSWNT